MSHIVTFQGESFRSDKKLLVAVLLGIVNVNSLFPSALILSHTKNCHLLPLPILSSVLSPPRRSFQPFGTLSHPFHIFSPPFFLHIPSLSFSPSSSLSHLRLCVFFPHFPPLQFSSPQNSSFSPSVVFSSLSFTLVFFQTLFVCN